MVAIDVVVDAVLNGVLLGMFFALVASGFSMVWASMRLVNIAHPAIVLLSAYIAIYLSQRMGLDIIGAILVTAPLMFGLGAVLYRTVLAHSYRSEHFEEVSLIATFGIAVVVEHVIGLLAGPNNQGVSSAYADTISILGQDVSTLLILSGAISLVAMGGLYVLLHKTGLGRAVRAAWQDQSLAILHGVDINRTRLMMFGLSTGLAGIAGVLLPALYSVNPTRHWEYLIISFVIVVLGGVGSIFGTIVAGVAIGLSLNLAPLYIPNAWTPVVLYSLLLGLLVAKPGGLAGEVGS